MDEQLIFKPATELAELIANKQVSPVELVDTYLERIDKLDPKLNSYLTLMSDEARKSAKVAEEAVTKGDELGPLHGVPISVKDLQMTKGVRSTGGSLGYKDRIPEADAAVIEKVRESGAIILGKTNTPEFGLLGASENRLGEECRNPWNPERTSGGSSGGAASSLAAGLCAIATGGDGGGSVRIPASFCGLYGIKPTQGRISNFAGAPSTPIANVTSQQGPISRTVQDSVVLLQAMAGYDPRDSASLRAPVPDFAAALNRDISGLRIGWSPDYGYSPVDPQVLEACSNAAKMFEALGCSLNESNLALETPFDPWWVFFAANAHATQGHLDRDLLTWYGRMAVEDGEKFTGADYALALGQRDKMISQFADQFEKFDLIISPTMPVTAFPVGQYPEEIGGREVYPNKAWGFVTYTHPINTIGHPAASVPCGYDSDGMPIGLHIVGRFGDEETVIAASAAFERAMPWLDKRPVVS